MKLTEIYDTFHMGRSSIDLYSNDCGKAFTDITSFAAYVGGSPTNISVGVSRLGLKSVLLTGVGDDHVGEFIKKFLKKEGVETKFIPTKKDHRSSAVLLGIAPPDNFPLVYYRDNCADNEISIDDLLHAPLAKSKIFQFAGSNLACDPCRSATLLAAEMAQRAGIEVVLDIDFRANLWHDPRAFGIAIRSILSYVDIVIGTEDELRAITMTDPQQMTITNSQISDARITGDLEKSITTCFAKGVKLLLEKRGSQGVLIHQKQKSDKVKRVEVPGFPVEVYNILGAGDAFAAGFLYGYLQADFDLYKAARLGNACGAIVVTKHGCANFMPTYDEVLQFIKPLGGF